MSCNSVIILRILIFSADKFINLREILKLYFRKGFLGVDLKFHKGSIISKNKFSGSCEVKERYK